MNNCMIEQLKATAVNENLPYFGELTISCKWLGSLTSCALQYGPGTVNNKLDDDFYVEIVQGGTINDETSITIPKGTVANDYAVVTFTRTGTDTDLVFKVRNIYTLNGFGWNAGRIYSITGITLDDLYVMTNLNRILLQDWALNAGFTLTSFIENQIKYGRNKPLQMYCYENMPYDVYEGETVVPTVNKVIMFTPNADFTQYELVKEGVTIAKRQLVDGVWTSLPTT